MDATASDVRPRPYGSPRATGGAFSGFMVCAQCGCRITYDPKIKRGGKRYDYYRCANGHRVHTKRIHVTEAELLAQFRATAEVTTCPPSSRRACSTP